MIAKQPEVGHGYLYLEKVHPSIISASSMPPKRVVLTVSAVDQQDVWYKRDKSAKIHQTSISRFMENVDYLIDDPQRRVIEEWITDELPYVLLVPEVMNDASAYIKLYNLTTLEIFKQSLFVAPFFIGHHIVYVCATKEGRTLLSDFLKKNDFICFDFESL